LSPSTIGMWESGRNKTEFDTIIKLAKIFNVSVNHLMGINDEDGVISIPVYSTVITLLELKQIKPPVEYRSYRVHHNNCGYIGFKITDCLSEPTASSGDIAIINLSIKVKDTNFVAVTYNGKYTTLRKVTKTEHGCILSNLSGKEPPEYYSKGDLDKKQVEIIGVVEEIHKILL
ncbi:MAG: XRE family transcriptional regulator, partial [Oscillospiraceae bacterium]|nr:XRE family transcriptional regulator [Oscillospiraceae bacterium]